MGTQVRIDEKYELDDPYEPNDAPTPSQPTIDTSQRPTRAVAAATDGGGVLGPGVVDPTPTINGSRAAAARARTNGATTP